MLLEFIKAFIELLSIFEQINCIICWLFPLIVQLFLGYLGTELLLFIENTEKIKLLVEFVFFDIKGTEFTLSHFHYLRSHTILKEADISKVLNYF